jgi:hypothetical protein
MHATPGRVAVCWWRGPDNRKQIAASGRPHLLKSGSDAMPCHAALDEQLMSA